MEDEIRREIQTNDNLQIKNKKHTVKTILIHEQQWSMIMLHDVVKQQTLLKA